VIDTRLQRRIQRYGWNEAATDYERGWQRQLEPAQSRLIDLADLQAGERVLDVACGTGLVSLNAAAAVGPTGEVVGVDLSDRMVDAARAAAGARGAGNTRFERMDADDLRLCDEQFDVVLCALGLMYVADPIRALREMHRVTRAGGRVVVAVWGRRDRCGWAEIFPIVDARVQSEVCPLFFQLGNDDALMQALFAADFTDVMCERLSSKLAYGSAEDACDAAFVGGPVALAYKRFDAATRSAVRADYLATIEPFRAGRGYRLPGEFVVGRGFKRA
jgi:SAM-dependent methyltransferase